MNIIDTPESLCILYVEDERSISESVQASMELMGYKVIVAENGLQALEKLKAHSEIDLIVTDIRMPQMDGLTMVKELRENHIDLPVIITSAFNETEYLLKAIEVKVDQFVNKPLRITALLDIIGKTASVIQSKRELERKHLELEKYREALDTVSLTIRASIEGDIISTNKAFSDYFAALSENVISLQRLSELFNEEDLNELLITVGNGTIFNNTLQLHLRARHFTVDVTAFPCLFTNANTVKELSLLLKDITPLLEEKDKLIQSLYTDNLTGLPNRQKLFFDLNNLTAAEDTLLLIDIDQFKLFNQLYGYDVGDHIIKSVAETLCKQTDTIIKQCYRIDHAATFAIILSGQQAHTTSVHDFTTALLQKLDGADIYIDKDVVVDVVSSAGLSQCGNIDAFTEASIALSHAKLHQKSYMDYADIPDAKERTAYNLAVQSRVKHALQAGNILNYYQPIYNQAGKIIKFETLVRMRDAQDPNIIYTPATFLDIARQSKNYALITERVIEQAFRDFAHRDEDFSINLSFQDIVNPRIYQLLAEKIAQHRGGKVTLELLESESVIDSDKTLSFCHQMRALGVKIAIDDFGSGYSNFINLINLPIDTVKLDGSLIKRVHEPEVFIMLKSMCQLLKMLRFKIIAEYVENEAILNSLAALEIDLYQGYYFSAPKPIEAFN